jgi:three-Cys-motif partner protein
VGPKDAPYEGREQTFVKHEVLRQYLRALALKIGNFRPHTTLNYIDGFSGPWDAVTDDHDDSSPAIAIRELVRARDALPPSKQMSVRAMFVESDRGAFDRLVSLCTSAPIGAYPLHGEFEEHIPDAMRFAAHGKRPFAFVFIDPTGWSGFALHRITPLLRVRPSEVLINFMLKDIARFIDDEKSAATASFEELFGQDAASYRARWLDLRGLDREDAIVSAYCDRVRDAGGFDHCVSTVIVNPTVDRTHYHLIFATRSIHGLTTFREIERQITPVQRVARADAKRRKRQERTLQLDLLAATELDTAYLESLRARYRGRARCDVEQSLPRAGSEVDYERLISLALRWPMTSEADVKGWLGHFVRAGRIELRGLGPRERAPKVGRGHRVGGLRD